ncbi:MAG: hypothetical protein M3N52_06745 [Actinomycetota bacterium]|nr:hypothetical protein [Actinomycetota bacterium]
MRFAVELWPPGYGPPADDLDGLEPTSAAVDLGVEVAAAKWAPLCVDGAEAAGCVTFVDGVRRIDARVWITAGQDKTRAGLCASYAAGAVRCDATSGRVELARVRRGLFSTAGAEAVLTRAGDYSPLAVGGDGDDELVAGVQQRLRELEIAVAHAVSGGDLVVIDGPLRGRQQVPGAVGYVKTHRVAYLPPLVADVVAGLRPGQRTPLFAMTTSWSRFSWYLRLPVGVAGHSGHPWAGVARLEASADLPVAEAVALAHRTAATLPRFASAAYKDPRSPQNLYPIGALERELRRRLGDPALLYRMLRAAAAGGGS